MDLKTQNLREFFKYTASNILAMLAISCYILADTFFISKGMGADGLTALNLAIPAFNFIQGCGLMFAIGGAAKFAMCKGRGEKGQADRIFTNTVMLALGTAFLFAVAGLFFAEPLAVALGADAQVFDMTRTYLRVLLLFSPAFMMNVLMQSFVRNDGQPQLAMMGVLVGNLINIVLDYVFIFSFGLGMLGAVLATGVAPVISLLIISRHWRRGSCGFRFVRMKPDVRLSGTTISLGLPSLLTEISAGIVMIMFNMIILDLLGNVGVAAYGVIANLAIMVTAIYNGVAQGMQPLISRFYGQNDKKSISQILRYAIVTMVAASVLIYGVIFGFADSITTIFNSEGNAQLQQIAVIGLKLYFSAVLFLGFNIVMSMYFVSVDKPLPGQVVSVLRGFLVIVPVTIVMAAVWGVYGVWLAYPTAEGVTAVAGLVMWRWFVKKQAGP